MNGLDIKSQDGYIDPKLLENILGKLDQLEIQVKKIDDVISLIGKKLTSIHDTLQGTEQQVGNTRNTLHKIRKDSERYLGCRSHLIYPQSRIDQIIRRPPEFIATNTASVSMPKMSRSGYSG